MAGPKDFKKFSLAAAAAYVGINAMDFLLHGVLLAPIYRMPKYASLWNPPAEMGHRRWAALVGYLPAGCVYVHRPIRSWYQCPAGWLEPVYGANGLYYRVVPAPL